MSKSGEGEYVPSPRPNPRLRPEGAAYAERNRGTMERWFDYSDTLSGGTDSGKKSAGGGGVGDNAMVCAASEGALQEEGLGWGIPERRQSPFSRAGGGGGEGGEEELDGARGSPSDVTLTEKCSQLSLASTRVPSAADEAREYAQRNRGTMDNIINNYGVSSPTSHTSQAVASHSQSQMTETASPPPSPHDSGRRSLHMESQGIFSRPVSCAPSNRNMPWSRLLRKSWDETRPTVRVRAEGESIAIKNSRDSMFDIMSSEHLSSPEASPTKKVQSKQTQESSPANQPANQPRARPGDGMKNYERAHDQSEMAAILRGEGNTQPANQPRNIRHLQRSELW